MGYVLGVGPLSAVIVWAGVRMPPSMALRSRLLHPALLSLWSPAVSATRWFTVAAAHEAWRVLEAWKGMASGRSGPDSGG